MSLFYFSTLIVSFENCALLADKVGFEVNNSYRLSTLPEKVNIYIYANKSLCEKYI